MRAATSRSDILQWLMRFGPAGWSTKTSPASFQQLPTSLPIRVNRASNVDFTVLETDEVVV